MKITPTSKGMKKATSFKQKQPSGLEDDFPTGITIDSLLDDEDLQNELHALGWNDHLNQRSSSKKSASSKSSASSLKTNEKKPESQLVDPFTMLESPPIDLRDVSSIGMIDESQLSLNDEDLEDPELLSMYQDLHGSDDDEEEQDGVHPVQQNRFSLPTDHYAANEPATSLPLSSFPNPVNNKTTIPNAQLPLKQSTTSPSPSVSTSISLPSFSKEDVIAANHDILSASQLTAEEATKRALQYRRDGNTSEALKWFRLAKQLEETTVSMPVPSVPSVPSVSHKTATTAPSSSTSSTASVLPPQLPPKPVKSNTTATTTSTAAVSSLPSFLSGKSSSKAAAGITPSSSALSSSYVEERASNTNPKSISDKS
jgi:hypothetical protein